MNDNIKLRNKNGYKRKHGNKNKIRNKDTRQKYK